MQLNGTASYKSPWTLLLLANEPGGLCACAALKEQLQCSHAATMRLHVRAQHAGSRHSLPTCTHMAASMEPCATLLHVCNGMKKRFCQSTLLVLLLPKQRAP